MKELYKLNDIELIEGIKQGHKAWFSILVDRHQSAIAGIIMGMLGRIPEADDVGQEVFIRFYNAIDQYKGESSLKTYLGRIAINLSLNELARQKKQNSRYSAIEGALTFASNDNISQREESAEWVEKGLALLDTPFRQVLVLRLIEGYSVKETAEIMDIPLGTVLSRQNSAQKKMKEILLKLDATYGSKHTK